MDDPQSQIATLRDLLHRLNKIAGSMADDLEMYESRNQHVREFDDIEHEIKAALRMTQPPDVS